MASLDAMIREFGNNSSLILSLANASAELSLQQLRNNSTLILDINNITYIYGQNGQSTLNWSTLLGIVLGFALSQLAEYAKSKRESNRIDKRLLSLLVHDYALNRSIMERNLSELAGENEILVTGRHNVDPLKLLETGSWDLIRFNLPNELIGDTIGVVSAFATKTILINEIILSRENFRINNEALNSFIGSSLVYNNRLISEMRVLSSQLDRFQPYCDRMNRDARRRWWVPSILYNIYDQVRKFVSLF